MSNSVKPVQALQCEDYARALEKAAIKIEKAVSLIEGGKEVVDFPRYIKAYNDLVTLATAPNNMGGNSTNMRAFHPELTERLRMLDKRALAASVKMGITPPSQKLIQMLTAGAEKPVSQWTGTGLAKVGALGATALIAASQLWNAKKFYPAAPLGMIADRKKVPPVQNGDRRGTLLKNGQEGAGKIHSFTHAQNVSLQPSIFGNFRVDPNANFPITLGLEADRPSLPGIWITSAIDNRSVPEKKTLKKSRVISIEENPITSSPLVTPTSFERMCSQEAITYGVLVALTNFALSKAVMNRQVMEGTETTETMFSPSVAAVVSTGYSIMIGWLGYVITPEVLEGIDTATKYPLITFISSIPALSTTGTLAYTFYQDLFPTFGIGGVLAPALTIGTSVGAITAIAGAGMIYGGPQVVEVAAAHPWGATTSVAMVVALAMYVRWFKSQISFPI